MAGIILAADIGTSSLKAAFIDFDGKLLAYNRAPYKPEENGDITAAEWERAFARALESLRSRASLRAIDGICISGNGPTLVPLTAGGDALPVLYWHDSRKAAPPVSQRPVKQAQPRDSFFLPQAAWLKKNALPLYEKVNLFLSSHEWLAFRLGAEPRTVLPSGSYEKYYWDKEQCDLFGLDMAKFPPFIKMGNVMGHLSKEAASRLALPSGNLLKSGTPIIAGAPDFISALIGTGTITPGDVCDRAGSSEGINACADEPLQGQGFRLLPHVFDGLWNAGIVINSSGRLFDSFRKKAGLENTPYGELLKELIPSSTGKDVFENLDFSSPSLLAAALPKSGSTLELGRSVLCVMAFSVKHALETLAAIPFPVSLMRLSGGQSKSARWNQLKADITGVSLSLPEISDAELAGNAIIAVHALEAGAGELQEASFKSLVKRLIRFRAKYEPESCNKDFWESRYRLYIKNNSRQEYPKESKL